MTFNTERVKEYVKGMFVHSEQSLNGKVKWKNPQIKTSHDETPVWHMWDTSDVNRKLLLVTMKEVGTSLQTVMDTRQQQETNESGKALTSNWKTERNI